MFQQPVTFPVPNLTTIPIPRTVVPYREPEPERKVDIWRQPQSIYNYNFPSFAELYKKEQTKKRQQLCLEYQIPKATEPDSRNQSEGNGGQVTKYTDCSGGKVSSPPIHQIDKISGGGQVQIQDCPEMKKLDIQYQHRMTMLELKAQQQHQLVQLRTHNDAELIQHDIIEKIKKLNKR